MQRQEVNGPIAVEDILSAVSVMDIPVDDQHPIQPECQPGVGRRDATLLYRQNPIGRDTTAWCPGGRISPMAR